MITSIGAGSSTVSYTHLDKFSTSSLVTRLTTDVTNVQMAYMMIIRIAVRCPFMLLFSLVMAFYMGGRMAMVFVFVVPVLGLGLFLIIRKAMPLFKRVFRKYDNLNESVQENIEGMRVVKAYVREDFETRKFAAASEDVCNDFTRAEKILALNTPLMQFSMYTVMLVVIFFGAQYIINTAGLRFDVGQFAALMTYGIQILVSLMMVSMILVMITMSNESARRIVCLLYTSRCV